jgi:hypothetical protein
MLNYAQLCSNLLKPAHCSLINYFLVCNSREFAQPKSSPSSQEEIFQVEQDVNDPFQKILEGDYDCGDDGERKGHLLATG